MFGTSVSTSVALNGENTATNGANLLDELTAETISTKQYAPDEIVTVVVELDGKTTLDVDEYVTKFKNDSIAYSTDESVTAYRADMVSQQDKIKKKFQSLLLIQYINITILIYLMVLQHKLSINI